MRVHKKHAFFLNLEDQVYVKEITKNVCMCVRSRYQFLLHTLRESVNHIIKIDSAKRIRDWRNLIIHFLVFYGLRGIEKFFIHWSGKLFFPLQLTRSFVQNNAKSLRIFYVFRCIDVDRGLEENDHRTVFKIITFLCLKYEFCCHKCSLHWLDGLFLK